LAPPDRRPDSDLARAAAGGDRAALEVLLDRHTARVYALCRRVLGSHHDALDATQEALISVTRSIARFDGRSAFTTWLYRVATNAALDEARRRGRRPRPVETVAEPAGGVTSGASTPAEAVEARLDIDAALAELPEDYRVAVVLRDLCDLDYAEIAAVLDVPPGTVRSRISRGRAALATALGGNRSPAGNRPTEQP
jgi:RNA polymerase sigma-70 factor (ECF subfamily)